MEKIVNKLAYPKIMGILNITPDSFSDGNMWLDPDQAFMHFQTMLTAGADMIDIGAESTRPGAKAISTEEEIQRISMILEMIRSEYNAGGSSLPRISIDTRKSVVAAAAIKLGAVMINDISALNYDPQMVEILKDNPSVEIILMHSLGDPETMQISPHYNNLLEDIKAYLAERIEFCTQKGISEDRILIDPGIGFGKFLEHNLSLIANLEVFLPICKRILLGASRKSFINQIQVSTPSQRLSGSLAAAFFAWQNRAEIIRVHDVSEHIQFLRVLSHLESSRLI
ncbi:MAG: dihydropteroate synthase [Candidatus Cloacimonetes bacterium]|nr:dihydropteroate synthase [Candidatus Cloacimonadota bacterium]